MTNTSVKNIEKEEIWKSIEEFPRYQVSNQGHVRTIENPDKYLAMALSKDGYPQVKMSRPDGNRTYRNVHSLVGKAFLKRTALLDTIIHLDYDKTNNYVENLKYVTRQDSIKHQFKNKNNTNVIQRAIRKVKCVTENKVFDSVREAARHYGIKSTTNISDVCNGKRTAAHGLVFEYVND